MKLSPEVNIKRVLVRTGLGVAAGGVVVGGFLGLAYSGAEAKVNKRMAAEQILNDGGFDLKDLSKLEEGSFRINVRRPWSLDEEVHRSKNTGLSETGLSREEEQLVADRSFGNALKTVREQAGCPVNSINRLDVPVGFYPHFGTYVVITRC